MVEHEEALRRVAVQILRGLGCDVLEARSASDPRRVRAGQVPSIDLLLTGVVRPVMQAPDLAKEHSSVNPRMRIVHMSGHPGAALVRQGVLEASACDPEKPCSSGSMTDEIRAALARPD